EVTLLLQRDAKIDVCLDMRGIEGQCAAVHGGRRLEITQVMQSSAKIVVRLDIRGIESDLGRKGLLGFCRASQSKQDIAQDEVRLRRIMPLRDHLTHEFERGLVL